MQCYMPEMLLIPFCGCWHQRKHSEIYLCTARCSSSHQLHWHGQQAFPCGHQSCSLSYSSPVKDAGASEATLTASALRKSCFGLSLVHSLLL
ncbi:unnamed protein product [Durusdinium trenchii]|uniref:Uncharacterized protein n=1 Tax=Durusdinium trenchii TaxID=1381693 RepID=A0ABP0HYK9_9DINO